MPKLSKKENKTIYQIAREEYGEKYEATKRFPREAASEKLFISADRLEKIESEKLNPHPEDVLQMSKIYKKPSLCNIYCSTKCPIGIEYVPEIEIKDLSQIVIEMLNSLNGINKKKERLIEIIVDGKIDDEEIADFVDIQEQLEKISITVETLQLWVEKMKASGKINESKYNSAKNK